VSRRIALFAAVILALGGCSAHRATVPRGEVEMLLAAPLAQSVVLVVSSDPFQEVPARREPSGTWKATLSRNGEFSYFFLVDGAVFLPECPLKEKDDFGSVNCVFSSSVAE